MVTLICALIAAWLNTSYIHKDSVQLIRSAGDSVKYFHTSQGLDRHNFLRVHKFLLVVECTRVL